MSNNKRLKSIMRRVYKLFGSLLCFFSLVSCGEQKIENKVEISNNSDVLGKLINLKYTDAISVTWISKEFTKERKGNDWYLLAKIVLNEKNRDALLDKLSKKKSVFDIEHTLTKKEMGSIGIDNSVIFEYGADEYFKEPLLHGSLAIDKNNVFIYLYTM